MKLPEEKIVRHPVAKAKSPKWLVALCIFALLVSILSAGFCAAVLSNTPRQIDNYVAAHRQELKGDKGDTGPIGPQGFAGATGRNGSNSYAPTHCYSSELFGSVSTNCY